MVDTIQKNKILNTLSIAFFLSILLLTGCASTGGSIVSKDDPYEEFNRGIYSFNSGLDDYVGGPISTAYDFITPDFVQTGIGNFFDNLKDINVVLNDLMQGKILQAGSDMGRFLVNTTVGIAGFFDVATEIGLEKHNEDFAQTLGVWGVPKGPYLMLPIIGPSTTRGIPGMVFDTATNPATYVPVPIRALELLNERAKVDSKLKVINEGALDPYLFIRESFLQSRQHLITDGKSELTLDVDDLDSELEDTLDVNEKIDVKKDNQLNLGLEPKTTTKQKTNESLEKMNRSFDELSKKMDGLENTLDANEKTNVKKSSPLNLKLQPQVVIEKKTDKSFEKMNNSFDELSKKIDRLEGKKFRIRRQGK